VPKIAIAAPCADVDSAPATISGGDTMLSRAALAALTLILAPPAAHAADLVVWWQKGWYVQEDEALREIIATFEQDSGKQVDVTFWRIPTTAMILTQRR
jgi:hypothetical protein